MENQIPLYENTRRCRKNTDNEQHQPSLMSIIHCLQQIQHNHYKSPVSQKLTFKDLNGSTLNGYS